jgi:hypothetical protein
MHDGMLSRSGGIVVDTVWDYLGRFGAQLGLSIVQLATLFEVRL